MAKIEDGGMKGEPKLHNKQCIPFHCCQGNLSVSVAFFSNFHASFEPLLESLELWRAPPLAVGVARNF